MRFALRTRSPARNGKGGVVSNLFLYLKRQRTLIASIKSLGEKLKQERKQRLQWQKLAINSLNSIKEIEQSVADARSRHREKADLYLYGE